MPTRRQCLAALLFSASLLAVAAAPARSAETRPLTVFAASSLKGVLDRVADTFTAKTGQAVSLSFAASSTLARQIEAGAPADLVITADEKWIDYLDKRGLLAPQSRVDLLGNRLVLVAPAASPVTVDLAQGLDLSSLLGPHDIFALGEPKGVPAGAYGRQALEHFGAWESVKGRISQSDSAKAVAALVARGEAPLGIVFLTDALAEPKLTIVATFPPESHRPIIYPAALVSASTHPGRAAFLAMLSGPDAAKLFAEAGFTPLGGN